MVSLDIVLRFVCISLPGKEALSVMGSFDGEVKLIHDKGVNYCYSWSQSSKEWTVLGSGDVSQPEPAKQRKQIYNGKVLNANNL